ncbi:N-acetylmuramoyl-L-alanine amidase [Akkermansiaceae bacterium]|nr:N-acetylmuramoyl-L-alanine amidase [Akkermansiaceae bacterium]MDB4537546.1 N-acetylmuramoyl-L-alanine amidase [Akkermansiaceae bacterium]
MSTKRGKNLLILLMAGLVGLGSASGITHVVAKSETFYSISRAYGVPVSNLMAYNKISDPRMLKLGQKIKIPARGTTSVKATPTRVRKVTPKSMRVIIDPGHGGKDRGALWGGVAEADLNMLVARKVEASLQARGYSVTLTRRSDVFLSLSKRAEIANRYRNAVFVSIHFNATNYTSVKGTETFYTGEKGRYLASAIQQELIRKLKVRNRGVRYSQFAVLRQTVCPAVLVECGFISNSYERSRCKTSAYQTLTAQAIVAGIERYDRAY